MKQNTPLALMEQVIMIAVFALAAALCLQAFALAERISRENEDRDKAVILAQNAAEVCIAGGGDPTFLIEKLGGAAMGQGWTALFKENLKEAGSDREGSYRVVLSRERTDYPGLGLANVCVYGAASGKLLFQIPTAWQEDESRG